MATAAAHVWDKQSGLVNPLLLYRWITYDVFAVGFGAHNLFVVGRRGVCVVHGLLGLCGVILLVVWWVLRASYLDKICYGSDGASASDFVHGGSCTDTSSLMGRVHGGGSSPMTLVQHILLWSGVGCVCGCVGVYVRTYVPYMRGLYRDVATNVGAVVDVRRWGELDELRRSAWWTQLLPLTGLVLALPEYALHKHGLFGQRLLFLVVTVGAFIGMMWSLWLNWTWGCYSAFIVSEGNTEILAYGQCTDATSQAYAWTGGGEWTMWRRTWIFIVLFCGSFVYLAGLVVLRLTGLHVGGYVAVERYDVAYMGDLSMYVQMEACLSSDAENPALRVALHALGAGATPGLLQRFVSV